MVKNYIYVGTTMMGFSQDNIPLLRTDITLWLLHVIKIKNYLLLNTHVPHLQWYMMAYSDRLIGFILLLCVPFSKYFVS